VHHLRSHIASNYLAYPDLKPPFLCLVVSGGHSHIVKVDSYTRFEVIGRTRDDAAGECYDKAARAMGMPYPGGVALDRLAEEGDDRAYALPRPHVEGSRYDFSFSGLKTAVLNRLHNAAQKGEDVNKADLCASFRRTVTEMLVSNTMLAAEDLGATTIVLAGGVAANAGLRRGMEAACAERGYALYLPPLSLCGDNGAMVAAQGYYEWQAGNVAGADLNAVASLPITADNR
jgi:N6-L-threonylcarbamoyladenine synthase